MRSYLDKYKIILYHTFSELKASVIERFNRTLKERMWRYFSASDSQRYTDVFQALVDSYNHSYHRSIKMKPSDVSKLNEYRVYYNLYGFTKDGGIDTIIKPKFNIGDLVRISKLKKTFEKGYTPNWSSEPYKIHTFLAKDQPVYKIIDFNDNIIEGIFYESELLKILPEEYPKGVYPIKILEEKKIKKGKLQKLKFAGLVILKNTIVG